MNTNASKERVYPPGNYCFWIEPSFCTTDDTRPVKIPEGLGCTLEQWEALTDQEREKIVDDEASEYLFDRVQYGVSKERGAKP